LSLVYFILASFGLTQIVVYGTIFEKVRPTEGMLGTLFHCPMCVGFWSGVVLWACNCYTELFSFDYMPLTGVFLGCLASGTSYVLNMVFGDRGMRLDVG